MLKKVFLLLPLFGWALNCWSGPASPPPCIPPAPTNIQFSQPNSTTLNVTWDPDPCSVSYVAILTNLTNPTQMAQGVNPTTPSATFTVIPGDYYHLAVAGQSGNPAQTGPNWSHENYQAESVIIEVIVKQSCPSFSTLATLTPNNLYFNTDIASGEVFMLEFNGTPLSPGPRFLFTYYTSTSRFGFNNIFDTRPEIFDAGLPVFSTQYEDPWIRGKKIRVRYIPGGEKFEGYITFPTSTSILFEGAQTASYTSFPSITIYRCSGGAAPSGSSSGSQDRSTVPSLSDNILPISPFENDLYVYFQEQPKQPFKAQLFDLSGHLHMEKVVPAEEVSGGQCMFPAAHLLPGMYFLRVETTPNVFTVRRVVKM